MKSHSSSSQCNVGTKSNNHKTNNNDNIIDHNHHYFILWPKKSNDKKCPQNSLDYDYRDKEGYVIGWQESDPSNDNDKPKIRYSTMTCIGVIPVNLCSSLFKVQQALSHMQQSSKLFSFDYLKDLKVIAYFQPNRSREETISANDHAIQNLPILSCCDYQVVQTSSKSNTKCKYPIAVVALDTNYHPYSQQSIVSYETSNFNDNDDAGNLEYYHHHCTSNNYYSSSFGADVNDNAKRTQNNTNIHSTLTRINEGKLMFHKLLHQLEQMKTATRPQDHILNTHTSTKYHASTNNSPKISQNDNNVASLSPLLNDNNVNNKDFTTDNSIQQHNSISTTTNYVNHQSSITSSIHKNYLSSICNSKLGQQIQSSSFVVNHWKHHLRRFWYEYPPLLSFIWYLLQRFTTFLKRKYQNHAGFTKEKEKYRDLYMPRFQKSRIQLEMSNRISLSILDGITGILFGIFLFKHSDWVYTHILTKTVFFFQETLLRQNVKWLETIPAGFKLNKPLTHNMSREILQLVEIYEHFICQYIFPEKTFVLLFIQSFGFLSGVLGISFFLATIMDTTRFFTLHTSSVLATPFRWVYRRQLQLFNSLWHLFRGKKIDVLRSCRSDSLRYDSIQLLLGMFLFMMCLFLFTTIWAYYIFFVLLDVFVQGIAISIIWWGYFSILNFPFGSLYYRLKYPKQFCKNIYFKRTDNYIEPLSKEYHQNRIRLFEICTLNESYSSILTAYHLRGFSQILKRIPKILGKIVTGAPYSFAKLLLNANKSSELK